MTTTTLPKTLRSFYNLTAPEALEARCTALLLVDFQREFTDGALPVPDAPSAIERASLLLRWARTAGLHAVHVHQESPEGGPLFAAGTRSAKIVDELSPAVGELVIHKRLGGGVQQDSARRRAARAGGPHPRHRGDHDPPRG